ncbi:MAG: DMT family transporter, partial [Pseudomonadota bacterium]
MTRLINLGMLLAIAILSAVGIAIIKAIESGFTPIFIGAARASFASAAIFLFCALSRQSIRPALERSGYMIILGAVGLATLWSMLPMGEEHISSAMATLMVAFVPFTALIVVALPPISTRVHWLGWVGLILGTSGLVLALGPHKLLRTTSELSGVAWVAGGYACFGVYCVLAEKLTQGLSPVSVAGVSIFYASVILWVLAFLFEAPLIVEPSVNDWSGLLILAVICTAIPYFLNFALAQRAGGVFVSLYAYIMPIVGIGIGYVFFQTAIAWTLLIGLPVTLLGMALVQ